jgi:PAT family beta-lactamase induction signal transducer AmpG
LQRPRTTLFLGSIAAVLYFSEGLPYGVVRELIPAFLRFQHVDLPMIGKISSVAALAWSLKLLWSPLVDTFGSYRRWIAGALAAAALSLMAMATTSMPLFYALIVMLAVASATQDIAVDAFTIRATPQNLLGPVNSIRVAAYRVALIAGGGALLALVDRTSWTFVFVAAAAISIAIFFFALTLPDDRGERAERPNLLQDLRHWLQRPNAATLLAIVFLYRLGELSIVPMIKPYWVDRGYSATEIGTITGIIGISVSIVGTIAGGAIAARVGLWRGLLWLGIAQNASNVGYALVATTAAGKWAIYAAAIVENLGYGAGTAAFLAFLMSICDRERAATEYALLTAAYGLTGSIMVAASGYIAKYGGYPLFFWLTVFLGVPALLLLPKVKPAT